MKASNKPTSKMDELLLKGESRSVPKIGELVEGTIITVAKNEVHLDIDGLTTGVVRGKEIYDESGEYSEVKSGDRVSATVLEIENESGQMELSFRYAGHQKAWGRLEQLLKSQEVTEAKIIDANKGGLMVKLGNVMGFLPVSQLTTENYPRVEGGDKNKILSALKKFTGTIFKVKVIDINENEEKLIVSEKAAWEEKQNKSLAKYKVGDVIELKPSSRESAQIQAWLTEAEGRGIPQWLELDKSNFKGRIKAIPSKEELEMPVNEQLVVELYSR